MAVWCFCVLCGSTTLCVCVRGGIWQSSRTLVGHEPHQPTTTWWCCEVVSFHHCPSFHVAHSVCVWDETRVVMVTMVASSHCIAINNTRTTCMSSIWPLTHLSAFFLAAFWLLMAFKKVCVWHGVRHGNHWHFNTTFGTHTHTSETVIGGTPNWWLC